MLRVFLTVLPYILAVWPGKWLIRKILVWSPLTQDDVTEIGRHLVLTEWIGIFERWLVIFLATRGEWTGLGLIVAAKGLLRMPELSKPHTANGKDLSHLISSYILLGTLISITFAIFLSRLPQWIARILTNS